MNYRRLYEYRFRDVDQKSRQATWGPISAHVYERLGRPRRVLDPAAGRCEFINAVEADERWVIDDADFVRDYCDEGVEVIVGNSLEVELPRDHFDGVFVSNFLEHLHSQEQIAALLEKLCGCMSDGGRIAVMGPNFRYCSREYFDCADHTVPLTHTAVEEHLYAAGFTVVAVVPRFLPYSFRSRLPASQSLTAWYLRLPLAWRVLGKQFLVVGEKRVGSPT